MDELKKIDSFTVDHLCLFPGVYVSRKDGKDGVMTTSFDLRMTAPNREPVIDMPALHTIEHLGATYLRNCEEKDDVIYFGPMGCRTGCYLVMFGDLSAEEIFDTVLDMVLWIADYEGEIPGAKPEECGNFSEQNLNMAKYYARRYAKELQDHHRTQYGQRES